MRPPPTCTTGRRVGDGLALDLSGDLYEEYTPGHWHDRAMRDPWVMRDPDGDGWLMYFTARIPGVAEPNAGGAIGLATSPNLYDWTLQPPVYAGGTFGQMEVPQVFEAKGRWYCLFCTDGSTTRRHMRHPIRGSRCRARTTWLRTIRAGRGRWRRGRSSTAIRRSTAMRRGSSRPGDGLMLLGFLHNPGGGAFVGEIPDPVPVTIDANGWLKLG